MRVLIIADEVWNDRIHGNNVLTNWFQGFLAEFAEIYASPGTPYNSICRQYFRLTDREMLKSIFTGKRLGSVLTGDYSEEKSVVSYNSTDIPHLDFVRKHLGNFVRLAKTVVWNLGRIDEEKLRDFIVEFNPDIIFSARFAHSKILRLKSLAVRYANCR